MGPSSDGTSPLDADAILIGSPRQEFQPADTPKAGAALTSTATHSPPPSSSACRTGSPVVPGACEGRQEAGRQCPVLVQHSDLVQEVCGLNSRLRCRGFKEVPCCQLPGEDDLPGLSLDARQLWTACQEVLQAYDERGRRLRDALLQERAGDRQQRDARVSALLSTQTKLEARLQAKPAQPSPQPAAAPETPQRSPAPPASKASPPRAVADRESVEALLRARTAEVAARQRERDFERLRGRLEAVLASDAGHGRGRARAAAAGGQPSEAPPGGGGTGASGGGAVAAAQAEVLSLKRQVKVLTMQLEGCDKRDKLRQALSAPGAAPIFPLDLPRSSAEHLTEAAAAAVPGLTAEALAAAAAAVPAAGAPAPMALPPSSAEKLAPRAMAEAAAAAADVVAEGLGGPGSRPRAAAESSESPWQREVFRLRDELASLRRSWRAADGRELMRRDRELTRLGLDAAALERQVSKSDLVAILLDVCLELKVSSLSLLVPAVARCRALLSERAPSPAPPKPEARAEAASEDSHARRTLAELAAQLACKEAEVPDRAAQLAQLGALAGGLAAQLRCEPRALPDRVAELLARCDESAAARRVVATLERLLYVRGGAVAVLPALREVLDVEALRRRAAACGA